MRMVPRSSPGCNIAGSNLASTWKLPLVPYGSRRIVRASRSDVIELIINVPARFFTINVTDTKSDRLEPSGTGPVRKRREQPGNFQETSRHQVFSGFPLLHRCAHEKYCGSLQHA